MKTYEGNYVASGKDIKIGIVAARFNEFITSKLLGGALDALKRHDVELKKDDCLIDYIVKTRVFMPKYTNYTIPITNAMYNEDVPEDMKFDLLMNSYKTVKDAFSK